MSNNEGFQGKSIAMTPPPEGVISGDTIPQQNQEDDIRESLVKEIANKLKMRGGIYAEMSQSEREEKAREIIKENGD